MRHKPISIGDRFERLTITGEVEPKIRRGGRSRKRWAVRCACGVEKVVMDDALKCGDSGSCGCARIETARARAVHGHNRRSGDSAEYRSWHAMKKRCANPTDTYFHLYGGRGIVVCERWAGTGGFVCFLADMGLKPTPKHSIDRIDNDRGYEPGNCRWASAKEQARNKSTSRLITAFGKTLTLSEWAEISGFSHGLIRDRIVVLGWSPEDAVSTPPRHVQNSGPSRQTTPSAP